MHKNTPPPQKNPKKQTKHLTHYRFCTHRVVGVDFLYFCSIFPLSQKDSDGTKLNVVGTFVSLLKVCTTLCVPIRRNYQGLKTVSTVHIATGGIRTRVPEVEGGERHPYPIFCSYKNLRVFHVIFRTSWLCYLLVFFFKFRCVKLSSLSMAELDLYNITGNYGGFNLTLYTDPFKKMRRTASEEYWK